MPALCVTLADSDPSHNTQGYLDANKANTIPAAIDLKDPTNSANNISYTTATDPSEIHGRGNSTWALPKKPYQIKFAAKTSVLGMTAAKKWVLLANQTDPSFMRNAVALSLGKALGLDNSPDYAYVDLFINGSYRGNYQVTEKAEIGNGRITKTSKQQVMIEMDNNHYAEEPYYYTLPSGTHITLKDAAGDEGIPDMVTSGAQPPLTGNVLLGWDAAKAKFTHLDLLLTSINSGTATEDWATLSSIIDVDSFVKYYWVQEVTENFDLPKSSIYFWYDPATDGKIHAGPVWDFDMTLQNFPKSAEQRGGLPAADYARNAMFYRQGDTHNVINPWYGLLYRNQEFATAAHSFYSQTVSPALASMPALIDSLQVKLANSANANLAMWPLLNQVSYISPTRIYGPSFASEVARLRTFVTDRKAYLDSTNGDSFPMIQGAGFSQGRGWDVIPKYDGAGNVLGTTEGATVQSGQFVGTTGLALPLTALKFNIVSRVPGGLSANVYVSGIGWTGYQTAAGTGVTPWTAWPQVGSPGGNTLQAIQLQLTGDLAAYFDLQYRTNSSGVGWSGWTPSGASAGTLGRTVEAVQLRLVKKATAVLSMTASSHEVNAGQAVTFTVSTWPGSSGVPVTFTTADGVTLGTVATDGTGTATLSTALPWTGEHDVTATLGGTGSSATTHVSVLNTMSVGDPTSLYHAVDPVRVLDTRSGNGVSGPVGAGKDVVLKVLGRGTVPATGVSAVVLNVTVTGGTQAGVITVFPNGSQAPEASNLNYSASQTVSNLVLAKPGPDGSIVLRNSSSGSVQIIADVAGYEAASDTATPGALIAVTPSRVLDTRTGKGVAAATSVPGKSSVTLQVTGVGGIPSSSVSAVILNVTVTQPAMDGHISVYPAGGTGGSTSSLNFTAGQTVPNLVLSSVSADGAVTFYNGSEGSAQIIADVAGYVVDGSPVAAGGVTPLTPARVLDTRDSTGPTSGSAIPAGGDLVLKLTGVAGVPASGVDAVALNVTAVIPSAAGWLSVYPNGGTLPGTSNVNYAPGTVVPIMAIAKLGTDGSVVIHNGSPGTVHVLIDVTGWVAVGSAPAAGTFIASDPTRILDTRVDNGYTGVVPAGGVVTLRVAGRGGVPARGVGAVVLNVTVTSPTADGFITAYPSDAPAPEASNLNFGAASTVANMAVVGLGPDGSIKLANTSSGTVHLIADVTGYFVGGTPDTAGSLVTVTPARVLDTRDGTGATKAPVAGGTDIVLTVVGRGGVPASGAGAVVLNVTVTDPKADGFVTVYPYGAELPTASNLNFTAGQTVPNLVLAKVGADGKVVLHNGGSGSVQLIADVVAYVLPGTPVVAGTLTALSPIRALDTRYGTGVVAAGALAGKGSISLDLSGTLPITAKAVIVNVTVTNGSQPGFVTVYPSGGVAPSTSNVNFNAGQTVPNLVMVAIGPDGKIVLWNGSSGSVEVIADIVGWYS